MICTKKYTCKNNNNNKKKTIYETKTGKQKREDKNTTKWQKQKNQQNKKTQTEVSSPVFLFLNGLCVHLLK